MPNFIEAVRRFEGRGPLDVLLGIGFVAYGILAAEYLAIVGAGLGFMRFLIHRALNPQERYVAMNSHEQHQTQHLQTRPAVEHTHGALVPTAAVAH